jgi:hypothetical protein
MSNKEQFLVKSEPFYQAQGNEVSCTRRPMPRACR